LVGQVAVAVDHTLVLVVRRLTVEVLGVLLVVIMGLREVQIQVEAGVLLVEILVLFVRAATVVLVL
jgi:hypothetical protein